MYYIKHINSEYIALFVSVTAICANVYISWINRKYALVKEEYFKLKQIAEKVISKLIILENDREKLKLYFEALRQAQKISGNVDDINDTLNKAEFENECTEVVTLIEIYFDNLGEDWNLCLYEMEKLYNLAFRLRIKVENGENINWQKEACCFNEISEKLGNNPKEISDRIKDELRKFKKRICDFFIDISCNNLTNINL